MKLFIDTTQQNINITLFDEEIINSFTHCGNNDHTITVYEILQKIDLKQVTAVYVTNGPGSFTGIRIGVLIGKTIAHQLEIDLFVINTLKLFYAGLKRPVAIDARSQQYFTYDGEKFGQVSYDDSVGYQIISQAVESKWLLDPQFLACFTKVDPLQAKVEYMKDVL